MRLAITLSAASVLFIVACSPDPEPTPAGGNQLTTRLGGDDVTGYARAFRSRPFVFPRDHGPHDDFRNEWWYLTGNLDGGDGRRFGFQATFFRIALAPSAATPPRESAWATRQVWMAHVALSDAGGGRHYHAERFARGALGLAGANATPFRVWLDDWELAAADGDDVAAGGVWRLRAETSEITLDLSFNNLKNIVLQGKDGLSQKGAEAGNASYYYSLPRLGAKGTVSVAGEVHRVTGLAWLDREWSTSALGPGQLGWDWFALQFDDRRELMFYRLRGTDGVTDPHSAGSLNGPRGDVMPLSADDVTLETLRWWDGGDGIRYPVSWRLQLRTGERYRVEAVFDAQRMDTLIKYWEGMVDVFDDATGIRVGRGYLEMTGYE